MEYLLHNILGPRGNESSYTNYEGVFGGRGWGRQEGVRNGAKSNYLRIIVPYKWYRKVSPIGGY